MIGTILLCSTEPQRPAPGVQFMVIAAPRSGTTWAANWLTTDRSICLHDPLWDHHYEELDNIRPSGGKMLGVSCTGLFLFPKWLNNHPARKVILHRPLDEINVSLEGIGLPPVSQREYDGLDDIAGMHVDWRTMWDDPRVMYEYLLQRPFDQERHKLLKSIEMQPDFEGLTINPGVTRRLMNELGVIADGSLP